MKSRRTKLIVGTRLTLTAWLFIGAVVIPGMHPFLGRGPIEASYTEFHNIQSAVTAMMVDQGLSTLTTPQTTATNDLNQFPETAGDRTLWAYGGNTSYNYVPNQFTTGTYTVDAKGTVTQVTTGFRNVDQPTAPMEVFLLVGSIMWLGIELFGLVYMIRIKKELSKEIRWWKSPGNIVYQLLTIPWAAFLLLTFLNWATHVKYYYIDTPTLVISLVSVFGIAIADGFVIYRVKRE